MDVSPGLVLLLGLCVGSFLNVLADRLPRGESVLWTRSHCDYCKKPLRWFELIPIVSFVLQAGRCRRCHKKLSWQYPTVELITAGGFLYAMYGADGSYGSTVGMGLIAYWLIFSSLLVIFVSDLKYQIIPDSMVIVGVIGAIGVIWGIREIGEHTLVGLGAAAFFFLLWMVTRGRGMGLGDVKLAFLLGLLLGYPRIVVGLYSAFLTGATTGVILMMTGRKTLKSTIAFGPFLIIGAVIALLWSTPIIGWWKGLI